MSAITALNSSRWFRDRVRCLANLAISAGRIQRKPCPCGNGKAIAHHDDYAKPFSIRWLCALCHCARHRKLGWGYKGGVGEDADAEFQSVTPKAWYAARRVIDSPSSFRCSFSLIRHLASHGALPKELALK